VMVGFLKSVFVDQPPTVSNPVMDLDATG
jgi:hypothetical protein